MPRHKQGQCADRRLVPLYLARLHAMICLDPNALAEVNKLEAAFRKFGLVDPMHRMRALKSTITLATSFAFKLPFLAALALVALILSSTPGPVKAAQVEFDDASVADLEAAMKSGALSSEKLVKLCLA